SLRLRKPFSTRCIYRPEKAGGSLIFLKLKCQITSLRPKLRRGSHEFNWNPCVLRLPTAGRNLRRRSALETMHRRPSDDPSVVPLDMTREVLRLREYATS